MSIEEIENEIVEEFSLFETWEDKYQYLIDLGKDLKPLDEKYKTHDRLIKGCQNNLWLHSELKDGLVCYSADSDGIISKGIASLLIRVLDQHKPEDIVEAKLEFLDKIELKKHLMMTRGNGLASLIQQMKLDALALSHKEKK
jgi:cysteine desulfuration protein SufE